MPDGSLEVDDDENLCRILDRFAVVGRIISSFLMFRECLTIALPKPWRTKAVADGTKDDNMNIVAAVEVKQNSPTICRSD